MEFKLGMKQVRRMARQAGASVKAYVKSNRKVLQTICRGNMSPKVERMMT